MRWALLLVAGLTLSAIVQSWTDQHHSTALAIADGPLYLSSGEILKKASIGFDGLLADIYWIRTSLYFGAKLEEQSQTQQTLDIEQMPLLEPLLNITTELDPHHLAAYRFGAFFLRYDQSAGGLARAIEFVEAGIRNNPDEWRLYQDLGFIYWNAHLYREAGKTYLRGSQIPGAPAWMQAMAVSMIERGGDRSTAQQLLLRFCLNATDPFIKQICDEQQQLSGDSR